MVHKNSTKLNPIAYKSPIEFSRSQMFRFKTTLLYIFVILIKQKLILKKLSNRFKYTQVFLLLVLIRHKMPFPSFFYLNTEHGMSYYFESSFFMFKITFAEWEFFFFPTHPFNTHVSIKMLFYFAFVFILERSDQTFFRHACHALDIPLYWISSKLKV